MKVFDDVEFNLRYLLSEFFTYHVSIIFKEKKSFVHLEAKVNDKRNEILGTTFIWLCYSQ